MFSAFVRLVLISAVTLIITAGIVFMLGQLGAKQQFLPPPHPWFDLPKWKFWAPEIGELCQSTKFPTAPAGWTLVVPLRWTKDLGWHVDCPSGPIEIGAILRDSSTPDWLLMVPNADFQSLDDLIERVSANDRTKQFAVLTDSQTTARYLRRKAPQWLFGADSNSLLRLQMFSSLRLETLFDFWPDFVLATDTRSSSAHLTPRVAAELARRKKRVIWDARNSQPSPPFPTQGFMTTRPSDP